MKVQRLTIENSRWCPPVSVDVRDHLVIAGPNEAGKSTLLRLLDATLAWPHGRLLNELTVNALKDPEQSLIVEAELGDLDEDAQAAFADEIEVTSDSTIRLTVRLEVRVAPDDPEAVEVCRDFVKEGVRPIRLLQRHLQCLRWCYLSANRSAERELGSGRSGTVRALLDSVDLGDDSEALMAAVAAMNDALAGASSLEDLRAQIAAALSEVYPRDVPATSVSVQLPSTHDPLGNVDVRLVPGGGGEASGLLDQSDGLRSLSVLSLQLLVRGGATITAVDEPEIHLHPRSQARVARLLATKPGQRIVATHAPAVIRAFKPSEVLALTPTGARQLAAGAVESDVKFFSQWWVDATLEPLTSRGIILVEGTSDETVVRAVARLKDIDLDREGLSIVSLGGANNFVNAYKLFGPKGFQIPVSGLVDESEANVPAEALGIDVGELPGYGVFSAVPDLEGEYCAALGADRVFDALLTSSLFKEDQVLGVVERASRSDVTDVDLATFCRSKKHKTMAAIAISEKLTTDDLSSLPTMSNLIDHACQT